MHPCHCSLDCLLLGASPLIPDPHWCLCPHSGINPNQSGHLAHQCLSSTCPCRCAAPVGFGIRCFFILWAFQGLSMSLEPILQCLLHCICIQRFPHVLTYEYSHCQCITLDCSVICMSKCMAFSIWIICLSALWIVLHQVWFCSRACVCHVGIFHLTIHLIDIMLMWSITLHVLIQVTSEGGDRCLLCGSCICRMCYSCRNGRL